jgi:hypothetical protein
MMTISRAQLIAREVNHPSTEKEITNSIQIDRRGRLGFMLGVVCKNATMFQISESG